MYTKRPQKNNGTIQGTLHSLLSAAQNGTKIWYYRTYSPDGGGHTCGKSTGDAAFQIGKFY